MSEAEREFQVWFYSVSHSVLLLRSPRTETDLTNIDIVFWGVEYMTLAQSCRSLSVREATPDECSDFMDQAGLKIEAPNRLYTLTSATRTFLVLAAQCTQLENELDTFQLPFEREFAPFSCQGP